MRMQQMKNLLFFGALTLFYPVPLLAKEPPSTAEVEIDKPLTLQQQQLEEYFKQSNQRRLEFNFSSQKPLSEEGANKVQWQSILNEIQQRQMRIKQSRFDRVLRLPVRVR